MSILTCDGVSLMIGTEYILKDVSFSVNAGTRMGIIGVNGAGKSTLASVVAGKTEPTSGAVYVQNGIRIGMLGQRAEDDFRGRTVYEVAEACFSDLVCAESKLEQILAESANDPDKLSEYEKLRHDFEIKGGNEYKTRIKSMLARFGFGAELRAFPADSLSGGQKTRLALASLLISDSDVIILDEPTNHLDADTTEWLENFILSSPRTYIIISHDRYFLDRVTTETLELENLTVTRYTGGYSEFAEKKRRAIETQQKHYEQQQKEIKRIEAYIDNQYRWGQEQNFIAAKSRQKLLDKIERVEKPKAPPKSVKINFQSKSSGYSVLSVRNVAKRFGSNVLFDGISFEISRGERVMVIGANGCGKSTLLKIITGSIDADSGVCELGYAQNAGYYDQEIQLLDENNTVLDEMLQADKTLIPVRARTILGSFGFTGDDAFKKVNVLSGGERARLSIAKLILKKVSLLILDEPTNHLDIPSKEAFEAALESFEGTVLAVSHDRYFINRLGTRIIEIDREGYENGYFDFRGRYGEFLQKRRKSETVKEITGEAAGKTVFENAKKKKSERRTREKRFEYLTTEIARLEARLGEIEAETAENPADYVMLASLDAEQNEIRATLDGYYDEYITLEEELNADV
ncbi:MAG: ABC-F family ATP-binding cassette domain-containing protein [Clostridia bacterium]|nr:ABC-F family ATP-binding cassette domain-containing protein [Clostridia bacterium]